MVIFSSKCGGHSLSSDLDKFSLYASIRYIILYMYMYMKLPTKSVVSLQSCDRNMLLMLHAVFWT